MFNDEFPSLRFELVLFLGYLAAYLCTFAKSGSRVTFPEGENFRVDRCQLPSEKLYGPLYGKLLLLQRRLQRRKKSASGLRARSYVDQDPCHNKKSRDQFYSTYQP